MQQDYKELLEKLVEKLLEEKQDQLLKQIKDKSVENIKVEEEQVKEVFKEYLLNYFESKFDYTSAKELTMMYIKFYNKHDLKEIVDRLVK